MQNIYIYIYININIWQVSGVSVHVSGFEGDDLTAKNYLEVEDLEVYKKLCRLHIEVCDLTHTWPQEKNYGLGSQARRSSNSAPAQLAEKNDDRHVRNKIEGSLQRMHSHAQWIGENIGAKDPKARATLADSRGTGSVWLK